MKILILGGYGTFGGRLAQLLADQASLTLIIAGRSEKKAKEFCDSFLSKAKMIPLRFDRNENAEAIIREANPNLVVDATGPFQVYGDDPYRIVKACIANGIDYMDLADGTDFVKGIHQFDQEAKAKNIFVLSGVSSLPVLSFAVIRRLSKHFSHIEKIKGGIAPSPYAGVGLNVIRALSSYAGKSISLTRNKQKSHAYALTETMRYTVATPGRVPLGNILFSLVDVPDLVLIPDTYSKIDSIWLGAGPVPEILHRILIGLSWLVRFKLLPSLLPFASLFHFAINVIRWGEHRGGMFISIEGTNHQNEKVEHAWHLLAEANDGPYIPSMPVAAIILRILANQKPSIGARPAIQEIELEDYESIFKKYKIYTGERNSFDEEHAPLYKRILGSATQTLPPLIADMHNLKSQKTVAGLAQVEVGKQVFAKIAARLFGFPKAGKDIPVQVTFHQKENGELWQRTFAGKSFSSFQFEGKGSWNKLLCERFGPFTFGMALMIEDEKLKLVLRRWSMLGISLPLFLSVQEEAFEEIKEGRFCFNVKISHKLIGLIVHYQGWLA